MKYLILLFISLFFASCGESEATIKNEIIPWDTNAIVFTPTDAQGKLNSKQKIKPLNGMGNGPLYVYRDNRFMYDHTATFHELNVPIIRFHDVEYFNSKNEAVNISAIFPNEEADASLASSYNFDATDQLMKAAMATGAKIIFRLGENILNIASATGSNTPPSDFDKWAQVAERIVAHYETGWNDGYFYKGIMWEVWNEPDVDKCWNGSFEAYCEFYKKVWQCIHARHPKADISPAYAYNANNRAMLYQCIQDYNLGIEHCFAHYYGSDFSRAEEMDEILTSELEQYGLDADIILNEWNYLSPDGGFEDMASTFLAIQTPFIATWYAQQLVHMQATENLAGAVYYVSDMPGFWTGLYKLDSAGDIVRLPAYDVFKNFGELYRLGNEIAPDNLPTNISALAASDGKEMGIMVVNNADKQKETDIQLRNVQLEKYDIQINGKKAHATDGKIKLQLLPYEVSFVCINPK